MKWDKFATAATVAMTHLSAPMKKIMQDSMKDPWDEFFQTVEKSLAMWYAKENRLNPNEVFAQINTYFESGAQIQPQLPGWDAISTIELEARKVSSSVVEYYLYVCTQGEGRWSRVTMPIEWPNAWENAPDAIRKDFIMNGKTSLKRTLYSKEH